MSWSRWHAMGRGDRRLSTWEDVLRRQMVQVRLRLPDPEAFECSLSQMSLGDTRLIRFRSTPHAVERSRGSGTSDCEHLMVSAQLHGVTRIRSERLAVDLRPGDVGLLDTARPFENEFVGNTSRAIVLIDKRRVPPSADRLPLGRVPSTHPYFSIVRQHILSLANPAMDHRLQVAEALVASLSTLLTQLDGPSADGGAEAGRKVSKRDIDAFIALNVLDADLSTSLIAAALGLSLRSLFAIYENAGESLEQAIINARLQRASELLVSGEFAHLSVTTISTMVGFKDTSHFSRRFRAAYGKAPSVWRAGQS